MPAFTRIRLAALFLCTMSFLSGAFLFAQAPVGSLQGVLTDPSGARIPRASVTISSPGGTASTTQSGDDGHYSFPKVAPGTYSIGVSAEGFALAQPESVQIQPGKTVQHDLSLSIAVEQQQVTISDQGSTLDTSPDNNVSAIVIKGKDLDALSDDPDEMQDELNALAGPAAGPNGGQIYIDGFTGGQLPPKSSIREIRVNQNPFSAEFDKLGYGRIEILTKPGTDKLHGMLMTNGNDSSFNSLNTFVKSEPPYYSTFFLGNVGGSLNKSSSWFLSAFRRSSQANSIINAVLLDPSGQGYNYSQAVSNPASRLDVSPRFDFQLSPSNTLTVRYMYNRVTGTNDGVSQFALESQAYNTLNQESTLQVSDTQVLSAKLINETRFEYIRDRDDELPQNATPTLTVQGAFTGGGSNNGTTRDNQDHYELQNYTTLAQGTHAIRFGTRLRVVRDANYSTAGFNGNYTYASLSSYAAKQPAQYQVTEGNATARVTIFDAGVFFQDDWRVRPNFTFSYGIRFEGQNRISDHADFGPRLSFAWAPKSGSGPSRTVIRGGYGWFFDRFQSTNVLQAVRQNGINQQTFVVINPAFSANAPAPGLLPAGGRAPTTYQISPHLTAPVNMQAAIGVEHSFGKKLNVSVTYINSRGVHQLYTDNINAFLPGTYDFATGTGIRPNGIDENIYQYQSGGVYNQNQLITNYSLRARKMTLFGFYLMNFAKADTSGANYFPSNQFNPGADYGRSTFDVHNRFLLGGNYLAPFGISLSPFIVLNSGAPFNITLGQDLNGDNQFNDRPAFATASSTDILQTSFGNFDLSPSALATPIPYNFGNGPRQFSTNLRVSKVIGIGPRAEGGPRGGFNGMGGGGGPRGGPGGGPGGGLGPGGLSGGGGRPPMLDGPPSRRYSLTFSAQGRNIFNNVSLAPPVGVLSSQIFGRSNALAGGFFSSPSANRQVDLQVMFNF
ncbi:MAG TPA: carboxypeptidase regulatory-like domain-containing protein [Acidobacteriaceae bacterium]|nr:carboxypeptidase regulatory-like domain-containing protein [Acidobacteriaceae bacterium]